MSMLTSACNLPNKAHTNAIFYPFGLTPSSSTFPSTMPGMPSRCNAALVPLLSNSFALTCPQLQQSTSISNVKQPYPTPIPGMFTVYLFRFCPPKTSNFYGCFQALKPRGAIQNRVKHGKRVA